MIRQLYILSSFNNNLNSLNKVYEDACLNYLIKKQLIDPKSIRLLRIQDIKINPICYITNLKYLNKNSLNDLIRISFTLTFKRTSVSKTQIFSPLKYQLIKNIFFVKNLFKLFLLYSKTIFLLKNYDIRSTIIDHIVYVNGAVAVASKDFKVPFFDNAYPYGIRFIDPPNFKLISDLMKFKSKDILLKDKNKEFQSFYIPYLTNKKTDLKKLSYDLKNYDYALYCHSFTDAANDCGWDGVFINIIDWTKFTLDVLRDKKVIVKAHPNIYCDSDAISVKIDKLIYQGVCKRYMNKENFCFIDKPVDNLQFLDSLNKNCITITHHGTMIGECASNNKKIISSKIHHIFDLKKAGINFWKSREEYKALLLSSHEKLLAPNKKYCSNKFNNFLISTNSYSHKKSWKSFIASFFNLDRKEVELKPQKTIKLLENLIKNDNERYNLLIKEISSTSIFDY